MNILITVLLFILIIAPVFSEYPRYDSRTNELTLPVVEMTDGITVFPYSAAILLEPDTVVLKYQLIDCSKTQFSPAAEMVEYCRLKGN